MAGLIKSEERVLPPGMEGLSGRALLDALHDRHRRRRGLAPLRPIDDPEAQRPALAIPAPPPAAPLSSNAAPTPEPQLGSAIPEWCTPAALIVDSHNRAAWEAARGAWRLGAPVGPVIIIGDPGNGKSHMLGALVREWRAQGWRAAYATADCIIYADAGALDALLDADALAIDDLNLIASTDGQGAVSRLVEAFAQDGKPLVIATNDEPRLRDIEPVLLSRLSGGIRASIAAPEAAARRSIFDMAVRRAGGDEVEVPDLVAATAAAWAAGSAREVAALASGIVLNHQLSGKPVNLAMAEAVTRDVARTRELRAPKIEEVQRVVARHYGVSVADMVSARRTKVIVRPRQVAMFLAKTMTARSLPEIGRRFGKRDHTTALHAVKKIEALAATDEALAEDIATIKRLLD